MAEKHNGALPGGEEPQRQGGTERLTYYAISDIHGFLRELDEALSRVDLSEDARLVLLGDYIDYGPDSGGVLRRVWGLQNMYGPERVITLRGNHEDAFLEWLDTYSRPGAGQPDEYGLTPWNDWLDRDPGFGTFRTLIAPEQWAFFQKILPTLSEDSRNMEAARMVISSEPELVEWLRGLPYYHETPNQIFVHAGIDEEAGDWWPWATPEYVFTGKFPPETGGFYKDIVAGHTGTSRLSDDRDFHGVFWDGKSHYYIDGSVQGGGRLNLLAWNGEQGYRQWDNGWQGVPGLAPENADGV